MHRQSDQWRKDMTAHLHQPPKTPSVLLLGSLSGLVCFSFFWVSYRLTMLLSLVLISNRAWAAIPLKLTESAEPAKWIGGTLVILVSVLLTHAWDRLRIRLRLGVAQYWAMIGLALSICLLAAFLTRGL
jgi:hypothetical protein